MNLNTSFPFKWKVFGGSLEFTIIYPSSVYSQESLTISAFKISSRKIFRAQIIAT